MIPGEFVVAIVKAFTYRTLFRPKNIPFIPIYNFVVKRFDQFSVEQSIRRAIKETENGILTSLKNVFSKTCNYPTKLMRESPDKTMQKAPCFRIDASDISAI